MATIVLASLNTLMYVCICVTIMLEFVRIESWQKYTAAAMTLPEYIGFTFWLLSDSEMTRKVYLILQYISYVSLMLMAAYHFAAMLFTYLVTKDPITATEITVTSVSLLVYGILGTILLVAFQDYQ